MLKPKTSHKKNHLESTNNTIYPQCKQTYLITYQ